MYITILRKPLHQKSHNIDLGPLFLAAVLRAGLAEDARWVVVAVPPGEWYQAL